MLENCWCPFPIVEIPRNPSELIGSTSTAWEGPVDKLSQWATVSRNLQLDALSVFAQLDTHCNHWFLGVSIVGNQSFISREGRSDTRRTNQSWGG